MGNGTTNPAPTPVAVSGFSGGVGSVASGAEVTCATHGKKDDLFCWGANGSGQLGDDTTSDSHVPASVPYEAVQVSTGDDHSCAVVLQGVNPDSAVCWGANDYGELGNGKQNTGYAYPVNVKHLPAVPVQVVAGGSFDGSTTPADFSCALLTTGDVDCWGLGTGGQLGNGAGSNSDTPVQVSLSGPAKEIAAGAFSACALLLTGAVECWGSDLVGQLGDGGPPTEQANSPVSVSALAHIIEISGNVLSTCALSTTGSVSCWGDNTNDELGDGVSGGSSNTPQPVSGL